MPRIMDVRIAEAVKHFVKNESIQRDIIYKLGDYANKSVYDEKARMNMLNYLNEKQTKLFLEAEKKALEMRKSIINSIHEHTTVPKWINDLVDDFNDKYKKVSPETYICNNDLLKKNLSANFYQFKIKVISNTPEQLNKKIEAERKKLEDLPINTFIYFDKDNFKNECWMAYYNRLKDELQDSKLNVNEYYTKVYKGDKKSKLSQQSILLFLFHLNKHGVFRSNISKKELSRAANVLTGYSPRQLQKDLVRPDSRENLKHKVTTPKPYNDLIEILEKIIYDLKEERKND